MIKILALFIFLVSCGHMPAGRSYLSEMSREDGTFLEPYRDFPVVVGDTGSWGYSEEVRRMRTPASEEELEEYNLGQSLKWELGELEAKQSEEALSVYQKYVHHFKTISEKIYYLRLPYHERYSYLEARGIVAPKAFSWHLPTSESEINLGMSKTEIISRLGQPQRVEIAGNPRFENERWLYAEQGSPKYIYFESGKVGGWE